MSAKATMNKVNDAADSMQPYFTPPWCARQFCEAMEQAGHDLGSAAAFDPCGGMGHMLHGLKDSYGSVFGDDLFDHKPRYYTPTLTDYTKRPHAFSGHVVSNPPFSHFNVIALNAISAGAGLVAMLVRLPALAGMRRKDQLFDVHKPSHILIHTARPHMRRGVPPETGGDSAMDFCWVVWDFVSNPGGAGRTDTIFLPNTRAPYEREGDYFDTQPGFSY